jgi:hypothetical protein
MDELPDGHLARLSRRVHEVECNAKEPDVKA